MADAPDSKGNDDQASCNLDPGLGCDTQSSLSLNASDVSPTTQRIIALARSSR